MADSIRSGQARVHLDADIQRIEATRTGAASAHIEAGRAIQPPTDLRCEDRVESYTFESNPEFSAIHDSFASGANGQATHYECEIASDPTNFAGTSRWDSTETAIIPNLDKGEKQTAESACNFVVADDAGIFWFRWRFKDTNGDWGGWAYSFFTYLYYPNFTKEIELTGTLPDYVLIIPITKNLSNLFLLAGSDTSPDPTLNTIIDWLVPITGKYLKFQIEFRNPDNTDPIHKILINKVFL